MLSFRSFLRETFRAAEATDMPISYTTGLSMHKMLPREFDVNFHSTMGLPRDMPDNPIELKKTRYHVYTYPTYSDFKKLRTDIRGLRGVGSHKDADELQAIHDNLHSHPHLHTGKLSFLEAEGYPTEVLFSEDHAFSRQASKFAGRDILTAEDQFDAARHTFNHIISAFKHFKSLPVKPWVEGYGDEPHRITPEHNGQMMWMGTTIDPRRHTLYTMLAKQLGDHYINPNERGVIPRKSWSWMRKST